MEHTHSHRTGLTTDTSHLPHSLKALKWVLKNSAEGWEYHVYHLHPTGHDDIHKTRVESWKTGTVRWVMWIYGTEHDIKQVMLSVMADGSCYRKGGFTVWLESQESGHSDTGLLLNWDQVLNSAPKLHPDLSVITTELLPVVHDFLWDMDSACEQRPLCHENSTPVPGVTVDADGHLEAVIPLDRVVNTARRLFFEHSPSLERVLGGTTFDLTRWKGRRGVDTGNGTVRLKYLPNRWAADANETVWRSDCRYSSSWMKAACERFRQCVERSLQMPDPCPVLVTPHQGDSQKKIRQIPCSCVEECLRFIERPEGLMGITAANSKEQAAVALLYEALHLQPCAEITTKSRSYSRVFHGLCVRGMSERPEIMPCNASLTVETHISHGAYALSEAARSSRS